MYDSKLEASSGQKYLTVWYDPNLCNWDEVISRAMERHKLDEKVPILCLPKPSMHFDTGHNENNNLEQFHANRCK